nr:MAG TPA: hypothetical protein [Caudoviricetes sp.]
MEMQINHHERTTLNGQSLYEYMTLHFNERHTKEQLIESVRMEGADEYSPEALFFSAMRLARFYAEEDGLFIPDAVPNNGWTYVLTDSADEITGPWITNKRRTAGMFKRAKKHSDALDPRIKQLPGEQQAIMRQIKTYDREQEDLDAKRGEAYENLLLALIDAGRGDIRESAN